MKIVLTGKHFSKLVKGESVSILKQVAGTEDEMSDSIVVEVVLADIGFEIMRHDIDEAVRSYNEKSTSRDSPVSGGHSKSRSDQGS